MKTSRFYPILNALLAAALFGASTPISKLLLAETQPITLAALMYLGSGFGAFLLLRIDPNREKNHVEARLQKNDLPWLAGAVIAGGIAGPILLMISLNNTPASTASLLLNFESVATALIAGLFLKEYINSKVWFSLVFITLASIILSFNGGAWGFSLGSLGIIGACIFWGLDNNFTRKVSAKDPLEIVLIKGLGAGIFSLILSLVTGNPLPKMIIILAALLVGAVCYGMSIALFVLSLRSLGTARTGALFATAPFVGAILSLLIFHEKPTIQIYLSLPLMILGVLMLLTENHSHLHAHPVLEHEHSHSHEDMHHIHQHSHGMDLDRVHHSHLHLHQMMEHSHAHTPDLHHRHNHF